MGVELLFDAFSLHYVPFTSSLFSALAMTKLGYSAVACVTVLVLGIALVRGVHYLQPVEQLKPMGGTYHVGRKLLDGDPLKNVPPVSVFYPSAEVPRARGVSWLPYDDKEYLYGMASYAGIPRFLLRNLYKVSMLVGDGTRPLDLIDPETNEPRPVIVFSHGLASFHQLYSCLLMDMASRGAIIFAMNHSDGSAAFHRDSRGHEGVAVRIRRLENTLENRGPQLLHRREECRAMIAALQEAGHFERLGFSTDSVRSYLARSPKVFLMGHSFGAATVLSTALQEDGRGTVSSVVAFDPWGMPLRSPFFSEPVARNEKGYCTPSLLFYSEEWERWKENLDDLQEVCDAVYGQPERRAGCAESDKARKGTAPPVDGQTTTTRWLPPTGGRAPPAVFAVSICRGSYHMSVCDMSVLSPVLYRPSYAVRNQRELISEWARDSMAFFRSQG